jgi:hypothetical protein
MGPRADKDRLELQNLKIWVLEKVPTFSVCLTDTPSCNSCVQHRQCIAAGFSTAAVAGRRWTVRKRAEQ